MLSYKFKKTYMNGYDGHEAEIVKFMATWFGAQALGLGQYGHIASESIES